VVYGTGKCKRARHGAQNWRDRKVGLERAPTSGTQFSGTPPLHQPNFENTTFGHFIIKRFVKKAMSQFSGTKFGHNTGFGHTIFGHNFGHSIFRAPNSGTTTAPRTDKKLEHSSFFGHHIPTPSSGTPPFVRTSPLHQASLHTLVPGTMQVHYRKHTRHRSIAA
jgi:hypothetical protein